MLFSLRRVHLCSLCESVRGWLRERNIPDRAIVIIDSERGDPVDRWGGGRMGTARWNLMNDVDVASLRFFFFSLGCCSANRLQRVIVKFKLLCLISSSNDDIYWCFNTNIEESEILEDLLQHWEAKVTSYWVGEINVYYHVSFKGPMWSKISLYQCFLIIICVSSPLVSSPEMC